MSKTGTVVAVLILLAGATTRAHAAPQETAPAGEPASPAAQMATMQVTPSTVTWLPASDHERLALTVSGPEGVWLRGEFSPDELPAFGLFDSQGNRYPDGVYTYELRATPQVAPRLSEELAAARRAGDVVRVAKLQRALRAERLLLSGSVAIRDGSFVDPAAVMPVRPHAKPPIGDHSLRPIIAADEVIPDNLIVQGNACVGANCVEGDAGNMDRPPETQSR